MPASEKYLKFAELLYFQTFEQELPKRDYKQQDIEYIIQVLMNHPQDDLFESEVLH
jgi:hypothetical protein